MEKYMADPKYKVLFERRNQMLKKNEELYNLTRDSYIGGSAYNPSKYLIKNNTELEPQAVYNFRCELASYSNHVEPLLNIIIGAVYKQPPDRSNVPEFLSYVEKDIYKGKGIDLFMLNIALQSQLYPVAILIDSPKLSSPLTRAERILYNLNPYAVVYKYNEIRDFSIDTKGELLWILLDNTYIDNSDPMKEETEIVTYTLWTKTQAISFTKVMNGTDKEYTVRVDTVDHNLGIVPIVLSGFNNLDNDSLQSSPFQNIALSSKKIYNVGSMIDCSLFNGTFQLLVYPGKAPDALVGSYGSVAIIEFQADSSITPQFIKSGLDEIEPYITEIKRQEKSIYHQLGFKDPESEAVQYDSGKMKTVEFALKTQNILHNIAINLQFIENSIYKICAKYDQEDIDPKIIYDTKFTEENITEIKTDLDELFKIYPYENLRKETAKVRSKLTLADKIDDNTLDTIYKDIDSTEIQEATTVTTIQE